jgi:hypothetical protein
MKVMSLEDTIFENFHFLLLEIPRNFKDVKDATLYVLSAYSVAFRAILQIAVVFLGIAT